MGVEGCWWMLMGGCGGLLAGVDGWVWRIAGGC